MMKSVGLLEKRKKKKKEKRKEKTLGSQYEHFAHLDRLVCVDYCCARREYKKPCCDKRKGSSMKMC